MWIRKIKPLWLRERLFWKLYWRRASLDPRLFEAASLEFEPKVRLSLQTTDIGHRQIALLGFVERDLTRCIHSLASAGGLLVDVGANYGYFTTLWAAARDTNRVLAFEASPRNFPALEANIQRNGFRDRVVAKQQAVGNTEDVMRFHPGPEDQTGWGGLSITSNANTISVPVITLDSCFANASETISVLKVDVEGADTWVLEGARSLLRARRIKHVFFEENTTRMEALGIKPDTASKLLRGCGYTVSALTDGTPHAFL